MVSGMNWFPNRDAVLLMADSVWPELTKVMPDARLTIVGASPPQAILELAARDRRVDRHRIRRRCEAVHGAGAGVPVPHA